MNLLLLYLQQKKNLTIHHLRLGASVNEFTIALSAIEEKYPIHHLRQDASGNKLTIVLF
ncbi:hypothetical protein [Dapis sp. BLCC M229]|uniref:hypothetical protein n=1 Tax=Dapis sp. BLCC M229 TaxID=3400188 RepID=UPI003CEB5D72